MTKKLTITVSDEVYKGLHKRVGRRKISRFIDEIARERLADRNSPEYWLGASERELSDAYAEQAAYEATHSVKMKTEDEAWLNGLIGDEEAARAAGMDSYLRKPISPSALSEAVGAVVPAHTKES